MKHLVGVAVAALSMLVLVVYTIVGWNWRRQGFGFVGRVGRDTLLMFLFVTVGSAISGVISAHSSIRSKFCAAECSQTRHPDCQGTDKALAGHLEKCPAGLHWRVWHRVCCFICVTYYSWEQYIRGGVGVHV